MSDTEQIAELKEEFLIMVNGVNASIASRALNAAHLAVNHYMAGEADKLSFCLPTDETSETN